MFTENLIKAKTFIGNILNDKFSKQHTSQLTIWQNTEGNQEVYILGD